jgi:integrase
MKFRGWKRYESEVRLHFIPTLDSLRLAKLAPGHLEALHAAKLEAGFAPASVANVHAVIHRALARAERLGLVSRNVASLVQAPHPKSPETQSLTVEQAHALLDAARDDRLEALYVLAVATGMRLGELLVLVWADITLDTGAV